MKKSFFVSFAFLLAVGAAIATNAHSKKFTDYFYTVTGSGTCNTTTTSPGCDAVSGTACVIGDRTYYFNNNAGVCQSARYFD